MIDGGYTELEERLLPDPQHGHPPSEIESRTAPNNSPSEVLA